MKPNQKIEKEESNTSRGSKLTEMDCQILLESTWTYICIATILIELGCAHVAD